MSGACGDRVKTIKTIFVAEKFNFFDKKVFSGQRFRIKRLFYTSYRMAISVPNPLVKVNYFLEFLKLELCRQKKNYLHDAYASLLVWR